VLIPTWITRAAPHACSGRHCVALMAAALHS
jgi:hypothetical protein